MDTIEADALVIGAGAGGLCAAVRLSHAGLRTILIDDHDRVGGRASTEIIDGFTVNIGAIALEFGGVFQETFELVGAHFDVRQPKPAAAFFLNGKVVDVSKGGWGVLLGGITKQAAKIMERIADARSGSLPDGRLSTKDWLSGVTTNETVHAIFRNLCASIFACNADELPARAFLTYFTTKGAFKKFGFCPGGTIALWEELARAVRRNGEVWLASPAESIVIENGRAAGAIVARDGRKIRINAPIVISNAGPKATAKLAGHEKMPRDYLSAIESTLKPAANIVINFATREPIVAAPGLITFGKTRRICNMANMTATCPEMAPPGWHLYVAYAVPIPALGDFDSETEVAHALQDLRDEFPGFKDAKMLSVRVMRDDWPAQRSCSGYDISIDTGVPGLWCVGDAVKDYGDGGTQACAETARRVAERVLAARRVA